MRKGLQHPELDPIILSFLRRTSTVKSKVLEVGGGSGYMLDLIARNTRIKHLFNCEIIPEVYRTQASKTINLIGGDALNLPFKTNSFNYVVIKNLLHHLVGKTRRMSKENARRSFEEINRVVKDNGYIIVLEQYNQYATRSFLIFYLTLLLSKMGVSLKSLGLYKNVVVSFLTPVEIKHMLVNGSKTKCVHASVEIVMSKIKRLNVPWYHRLTFLMSNIGRVLFIGKVSKGALSS